MSIEKKWSLGHVLKALPAGIADTSGLWGVATAEIIDMDGDIVRVKGIDTATYHDPEGGRHMKLLANHARSLPNGEAPIIGRIEEFVDSTVTIKGTPVAAKLFRWTWAKDGAGNLTPLAKAYSDLHEGGYLDSFSIGFVPKRATPIKGGGLEYEQSSMFEISAVTVQANPVANAIKRCLKAAGVDTDESSDDDCTMAYHEKASQARYDKLYEAVTRKLEEMNKSFERRFDEFEDNYVAKSLEGTTTSDPKGAVPTKLDMTAFAKALKRVGQ